MPELVTDETLPRKAPIRGMPDTFGMCSQLVGDGACDSVLVGVGDGPRFDDPSVTVSSGSESIGARIMRARAWRRRGWGCETKDRDGPGSRSGELGRAENDLNEGAKRRGKRRVSVLGLCSALSGVETSDCAVTDLKGEYSVLVFEPGSRSGAKASAEMVRLWTSRRLWAVEEVPSLDVEPLEGLSLRFDARRRANGTRTRTMATTKRKPPIQPMTMTARLLFFDDCEGVDVVALA